MFNNKFFRIGLGTEVPNKKVNDEKISYEVVVPLLRSMVEDLENRYTLNSYRKILEKVVEILYDKEELRVELSLFKLCSDTYLSVLNKKVSDDEVEDNLLELINKLTIKICER